VEFGRRREGAAAVAELRRSWRRAIECGQRKHAQARAGLEEVICIPGRAGSQVGEAIDDGASSDGSGEQRLGLREIPARGRPGLDRIELRSKGRG
jgi:hypothetical protein